MRGLSSIGNGRRVGRRQKAIVCPTEQHGRNRTWETHPAKSAVQGCQSQAGAPNRPQDTILPRIAASRKRCWRFSKAVAGAYKCGRRIDNPPQVKNHCCPNWRGTTAIGQPKSLIPRSERPNRKSRLARSIRCCPNCGRVSGAPFLRQDSIERRAGGALKALSAAAWLNRRCFAVQIGFSKNLIWTLVVKNLPHKSSRGAKT